MKGSICFKDTHRENTPSNKTQVYSKMVNICVWVNGTLNQPFKKFLYSYSGFQKNKKVSGKTMFFAIS